MITERRRKDIENFYHMLVNQIKEDDSLQDLLKLKNQDDAWDFYANVGREVFVGTCGNVSVANGATRLVLVPEDFPFIAKINFENEGNWDELTQDLSLDYNEEEQRTYDLIKRDYPEFLDAFAYTTTINVDGLDLLIQEKIETNQAKIRQSCPSYYGDENSNEMECILEEEYGVGICALLEKLGINDVHSENVGIRLDQLVIFDFAGYCE